MMKNLTSTQLLLIGIAAVVFLVAAFSFYLLQDPSGPLPFIPAVTTSTATPVLPTDTPVMQASDTPLPTIQTSYTPFATKLTPEVTPLTTAGTGTLSPSLSQTTQPGGTTPSQSSTRSVTPVPSNTSPFTVSPTSSIATPSPTMTQTLSSGQVGITGRVVRNATPVANVIVEFKDDVDTSRSGTNQGGHYWFVTLAPSAAFSLTFRQSDNPQLTPPAEISSLAMIEGNLPSGVNLIDLPDLELSLNLDGSVFALQTPIDGAVYPAAIITSANKLPFSWADYHTGVTYQIELGPFGSDQPLWTSPTIDSTTYLWDGTLSDGRHVSEGNYWWRVSATKVVNGYTITLSTHTWDLGFY